MARSKSKTSAWAALDGDLAAVGTEDGVLVDARGRGTRGETSSGPRPRRSAPGLRKWEAARSRPSGLNARTKHSRSPRAPEPGDLLVGGDASDRNGPIAVAEGVARHGGGEGGPFGPRRTAEDLAGRPQVGHGHAGDGLVSRFGELLGGHAPRAADCGGFRRRSSRLSNSLPGPSAEPAGPRCPQRVEQLVLGIGLGDLGPAHGSSSATSRSTLESPGRDGRDRRDRDQEAGPALPWRRGQRGLAPGPPPGASPAPDRPGQDRLAVQPALQVVGQRRGRGVAPARLLLQALQADRLQVAATVGLSCAAAPAPRSSTCRRVSSGARPPGTAAGRSAGRTGSRPGRRRRPPGRPRRARPPPARGACSWACPGSGRWRSGRCRPRRCLARPKSVTWGWPCAIEQDVGRLEVAVEDAALVGVVRRPARPRRTSAAASRAGSGPLASRLRQAPALDEVHARSSAGPRARRPRRSARCWDGRGWRRPRPRCGSAARRPRRRAGRRGSS